jgi:hypothetical protein
MIADESKRFNDSDDAFDADILSALRNNNDESMANELEFN